MMIANFNRILLMTGVFFMLAYVNRQFIGKIKFKTHEKPLPEYKKVDIIEIQ